jgi:squalene synthase HpnC
MSVTVGLLREGRDAARRAVRRHDENFPVAVMLLPSSLRPDIEAVYAFCRATDDLGDEDPAAGPAERLRRLDAWEEDLRRCLEGGAPRDPRLRALGAAIARHGLDPRPFLRLVEANRMDQRQSRWDTREDLLRYCEHSATPVGRMVLGVLGYRDPWRRAMSDATCIGLQLANFWQDIRRDLDERGRIYLPREAMERGGVSEEDLHRPAASAAVRALVAEEVAAAREQLVRGAPLARVVGGRAGLFLRMFTAGGLAVCDAIERQRYDTLARRPAPGRLGRARVAAGVLARLREGR